MFNWKQGNQACPHMVNEVLCWGPFVLFLLHLHVVASLTTEIMPVVTRECKLKWKAGPFLLIYGWRREHLRLCIVSAVLRSDSPKGEPEEKKRERISA